jgi:hypothetical protein
MVPSTSSKVWPRDTSTMLSGVMLATSSPAPRVVAGLRFDLRGSPARPCLARRPSGCALDQCPSVVVGGARPGTGASPGSTLAGAHRLRGRVSVEPLHGLLLVPLGHRSRVLHGGVRRAQADVAAAPLGHPGRDALDPGRRPCVRGGADGPGPGRAGPIAEPSQPAPAQMGLGMPDSSSRGRRGLAWPPEGNRFVATGFSATDGWAVVMVGTTWHRRFLLSWWAGLASLAGGGAGPGRRHHLRTFRRPTSRSRPASLLCRGQPVARFDGVGALPSAKLEFLRSSLRPLCADLPGLLLPTERPAGRWVPAILAVAFSTYAPTRHFRRPRRRMFRTSS